ncbi:hypothetical protein BX667DRAFT_337491 [Coemansia mojavensis]|nr:hypothetical protein BX667DRAFT_337491 [Coemansia mojavensis]
MDIVIVTGASKGIGKRVCLELLKRPTIVIAAARSLDLLLALQQEASQYESSQLITISGDITDASTRQNIIEAVSTLLANQGSKLQALINNAALVSPTGPLLSHSDEEWLRQWQTNIQAPMSLIAQCMPFFSRNSRAVVLNVTSSTSQRPVPGFGPYGSTKIALNYLTAALASEYPQISFIAFYPGVVDTPMNKEALDAAQKFHKHAQSEGLDIDMSGCVEMLQSPISADAPCAIMANLALYADSSLSGKFYTYKDKEMEPYSQKFIN